MKIKHYTGTVVDVSEEKARSLTAKGAWDYVDSPPEKPAENMNQVPEGGYTLDAPKLPERPSEPQEDTKPAPTIQEMRSWALQNGIEGVKEKGKLPRHAVEAYRDAHKE